MTRSGEGRTSRDAFVEALVRVVAFGLVLTLVSSSLACMGGRALRGRAEVVALGAAQMAAALGLMEFLDSSSLTPDRSWIQTLMTMQRVLLFSFDLVLVMLFAIAFGCVLPLGVVVIAGESVATAAGLIGLQIGVGLILAGAGVYGVLQIQSLVIGR